MPSLRSFLLAAAVLSAPAGTAAGAAPSGLLRIGNGPEPEALDPHRSEGVSAGNIVRDLYEGLTALDSDGRAVPAAAQGWRVEAGGRRYRFFLREQLRWSDGSPLTADDFVAGLRRAVDPATAAPLAQLLRPLRGAAEIQDGRLSAAQLGARAAGPHTLVLELAHPAPQLPAILSHPIAFPVHRAGAPAAGRAAPVNGAYALEDWVMHAQLTLRRNPHWHGAAGVAIERVRYVVTEDPDAEYRRFRAGELDVTAEVPPAAAARLAAAERRALRTAPYLGVYYYGFNVTRAPFADAPALRRALSMAIDRELIVDRVLHGLGAPAYGFVPPATAGHLPQQPDWAAWPYAQRLRRAQALLAAAGHSAQQPLVTEIRFNTHESHRRIATVIAAMWRQHLGVETRLVHEEHKVFLHNRRLRTRTQLFRAAWMADFNDVSSFLGLLHSAHGKNDTGWRDAGYDAAIEAAARSADPAARAAHHGRAEALLLEQAPVIPIYFYVSRHLVAPRVRGWRDHPLDYHYSKDLWLAE